MNSLITQILIKLIPFFALIVLSAACQTSDDKYHEVRRAVLATPAGIEFPVQLAITEEEQTKGLSGLAKKDFPKDEGMLFFYHETDEKRFWMPDTYFALDIIFLDKDLRIVAIEKNVPFHPGRDEPPAIPRTGTYWARHVLEIRADSPLSDQLKDGMQLKVVSKHPLSQIESKIRLVK